MAQGFPPTPELLDPVVDSDHRSFAMAVEHRHLSVPCPRPWVKEDSSSQGRVD